MRQTQECLTGPGPPSIGLLGPVDERRSPPSSPSPARLGGRPTPSPPTPPPLPALADLATPVAVAAAADGPDLVRRYRRELLRIGARDLLAHDDVPATAAALSDAAIGADRRPALQLAGLDGAPVAVVGMGKLGGHELNVASDVDLLLVADDPAAVEPAVRQALDLLRACVPRRPRPPARGPRRRPAADRRRLRRLLGAVGRGVGAPGAVEGGGRSPATPPSAPPGPRRPTPSCGTGRSPPPTSGPSGR